MLTKAQIGQMWADARISFCLDKVPSEELAFARAVEAAQVMRRALQALDGPSHSWEESKAEAERILGAWLAEKPKEVAHADQA